MPWHCRPYGNSGLFITTTCNINWPEFQREFNKNRAYKQEDKLHIITRVFRSKLLDMLKFIKSSVSFDKTIDGKTIITFYSLNNFVCKNNNFVWQFYRCCFKALDCSMHDVLSRGDNCRKDLPFNGKIILVDCDFRQILLVIPSGTKD